jgi:hypothetical protein
MTCAISSGAEIFDPNLGVRTFANTLKALVCDFLNLHFAFFVAVDFCVVLLFCFTSSPIARLTPINL